MEPSIPERDPNDYNKAAQYAEALRMSGGRLSLQPTSPKRDEFGIPKATNESDDLVEWYAANPNKVIDLSRSDAKQHWEKLVEGMHRRDTNWGEQLMEVGGEIAKIPAEFIEGVVEERGNPLKIIPSAAEGVVRSVRDLYGMIGESENPTSPLFWARSTIRAIKSGKISQNWQEEAQQWNETRKFLWDSYKVQQGDMSVYETLPYVNMSEATAQKLRSLSNPKIAHAISFIGLELPSLLTAPFTGGATAGAAIAGGMNAVRATAQAAAKKSAYAKVMGTLTEAGKRLDALAAGAALRATGAAATGLSKAISIPANMAESLIGGNIDAIANRAGFSGGAARNALATQAINGAAEIGAGEIRQTVGFLGSLGLRTTAELAGEIGEQASLLAQGVVTAEHVNGLTVLERVANNKMLSPSAKMAAKAINVTVDPILQMSTAALKHGYKDSLFFAGLGYMNDRERGAVGGAAMGMVWGGYSGAFRHVWGNVSGLVQHERYIRDFDQNFVGKLDQFNPDYANMTRRVIADVDQYKSTRLSVATRTTLQTLHMVLDPKQKKQLVAGAGNKAEMLKILESRGILDGENALAGNPQGMFTLKKNSSGELVPILWLNTDNYRPVDFGHEVLGHVLTYTLTSRGQLGTHVQEFFGLAKDKGLKTDRAMAEEASLRMSLEIAHEMGVRTVEEARAVGQQIYLGDANVKGSVKWFEDALNKFRSQARVADYMRMMDNGDPAIYDMVEASTFNEKGQPVVQNPLKFIFEEFVAKHAENLFIHTNLQDLILSREDQPLRMHFERKYVERLGRITTELEMAGIRAKYGAPLTKDNRPTIQAIVYDDGVFHRSPEMDGLIRNMVNSAKNAEDGPINQLSPEMQMLIAKKHGKEFLFNMRGNGATLKGEKERNEMSAKAAEGAFGVIDALPDELKPKITVDEHGNRSADVYTMKDEVIDALAEGGFLDPESARVAKAFRDVYMQYESSGFTTPNLFYGINIGDSHRTARGNIFKRIFGDDVPATNRVFVPFELKVYLRTTDASGKNLRSPRGGFTATVVDFLAIQRRELKMWSRPDVKALWSSLGEFNQDFHEYMINFLKDPATRVDSATLFRPKFGDKAEQVRDIMYETFGASKRKDETYINTPREGYFSSHENPNFPIHSLKLENLIGVERIVASPFPYHHGRTYEPIRRNLSVAGFEEISANMYGNGQGYRVMRERNSESSGWKVFSPFGGLVGRYKDKDKAFKAAQKHLRKNMNPADILALPTDEEWSQMNRPERLRKIQEDKLNYHQVKENLANNRSLQIGPVVKGGKSFTPVWNDHSVIERLLSDIFSGRETPFKYFIQNEKDLKDYQASNKVNYNLGDIRIIPNQDKYRIESKFSGKSVKLIHHPKTGEAMVYVDPEYYKRFAPTDASHFILQDIQSEIQHVAQAFNGESIVSSYMNKEAANPSDFGTHNFVAGLIEKSIKAHESGYSDSTPDVVEYTEQRRKATQSTLFLDLLRADTEWKFQDALDALDVDKTLPEDFRAGIRYVTNAIRGGSKHQKNKQWKHNFRVVKSLLDAASRMLAPEDKNARVISYFDDKGRKVVGFMTTADVQYHAERLSDMMSGLPKDTVYDVAHGLSISFAHWAPQIAESKDMNGLAPGFTGMKNGVEMTAVSAEWTASQIGKSPKQTLFIVAGNRGAYGYTPAGMVYVIRPDGRTEVRGGTDAGGMSPQPLNANNSIPFSRKMPTMSAHDAKVSDKLRKTWFGKDTIADKMRDLAMSIIAQNKDYDATVTEIWSKYVDNQNHLNIATALHDLANDSRDQNLRHMAQATMGLALALDEGAMMRRFSEKFRTDSEALKDSATKDLVMNQYWDEAVADYNISAQTYWNVGEGKTIIEKNYEASLSSNFHNTFGAPADAISRQLKQHADTRDRFHKLAATNYSVGGVEALRPNRREEVIRSGLAREMRIGGKSVLAFEFSDAEAYLDLSSVQNKPHLLPFAGMPDSEQAFSDYSFEVKRRLADPKSSKYIPRHIPVGNETTLGKVFGHDAMYYYYPEMRDIKVTWFDGHGGAANTLPNGDYVVELGIRSFAAAELNLKNDPDGMVFNDLDSLTSRHIEENPLASVILHEAQHVLQFKSNMGNEHGHFFHVSREVAMGHFANLLGIKTNFAEGKAISDAMMYNSIWSDAEKTASKDVHEVARRIALAKDSPVYRELTLHAKPLLKTAVRNLAAFVAAEVDSGRMEEAIGTRMLKLDESIRNMDTMTDTLRAYEELTAIRQQLRTKYPSYSIDMHFDTEYRVATSALGMVSSVAAIEKATPSQRLMLIRQALDDFVDIDYIMNPLERMARETEARRTLTQDQLGASPRRFTEDRLPQGSVLQIVQRAMDSSTVETTKGLMQKQTEAYEAFDLGKQSPIQVVMKSIGGIGSNPADSTGFTLMGKLALARYFLSKAGEEMHKLNRFVVQQKGWEVVDGKLVLKTGNYVVSGDFSSAVEKLRSRFNPDDISIQNKETYNYAVDKAYGKDGTYTIKDIAEIAGIKIESEDVLSTGNSVMDKVAGDDFPPVFKVSEIKTLLGDHDPVSAQIVMLDGIMSKLPHDRVLTKNDLLNIMAYNHAEFELVYNVSTNVGLNRARENPNRVLSDAQKAKVLRMFPDVVRERVKSLLETGDSREPFIGGNKEYAYGRFKIKGGRITYTPPALFWAQTESLGFSAEEVAAIRKRLQDGVMNAISRHSVHMNRHESANMAHNLNRRLYAHSVMVKPILDNAYNYLVELSKKDKNLAKNLWLSMMEDSEISALRIAYMDTSSGNKASTMVTSGYMGGFDNIINQAENASRGLARIYGADSPVSNVTEAGGYASRNEQRSIAGSVMPSLMTLHDRFVYGTFPVGTDVVRAESGINIGPASAMSFNEQVRRQGQAEYAVGQFRREAVAKDMLESGVLDIIDDTRETRGGWGEDGGIGYAVSRATQYVQSMRSRGERYIQAREFINNIKAAVESGDNLSQVTYEHADMVRKFVAERAKEGVGTVAAIDELIAQFDRRIAAVDAETSDATAVLEMQLDSIIPYGSQFGGTGGDKINVMRVPTASAEIALLVPRVYSKRVNVNAVGTSLIRVEDKAFVDVDFSLADPNQPSGVTLPSLSGDALMPRDVARTMNTVAHNVENVVTGIIGAELVKDQQVLLSPLRQNQVMLEFLERLHPEGMESGFEMTSAVRTTVNGRHYSSHNTFASYADMIPDGEAIDLVTFATNNLRDVVTNDYQSGIFSDAYRLSNPFLASERVNRGVVGMMVAPYIIAHDALGFPMFSENHVTHVSELLRNEGFESLVEMAGRIDRRNAAQSLEFAAALEEWMSGMDKKYLERVVYECSSAGAIDGTLLRMNMLQMHVLAKDNPARADRLNKANEMGAKHGFDEIYADSGLYGDGSQYGKGKDVYQFMNKEIRASWASPSFWKGVVFGVAAMKRIESRVPETHSHYNNGFVHTTSNGAALEGTETFHYSRPSPSVRRHTKIGLDLNSSEVTTYMGESPFAASYGSDRQRNKFNALSPKVLVKRSMERSTRVIEAPVTLLESVTQVAKRTRLMQMIDHEGSFVGIKNAWVNSNQGPYMPFAVASGGGSVNTSLSIRRSPIGSTARRKLIVNRLANVAKQLGVEEISVQPARFNVSKRVSMAYVGITSKDKRLESYASTDPASLGFTGQSFGNLVNSERDKPSVGFAWKRLEDGRIMLNITPDTNIGGYHNLATTQDYFIPLGLSHRRTLGWDVNARTLIPQAPLSILRRHFSNKGSNPELQAIVASYTDFLSPAVLKQYEEGANAIAGLPVLGMLTKPALGNNSMPKVRGKADAMHAAISRIREGGLVMDFGEAFDPNNKEHVGRLGAMTQFNHVSTPEDGYVTVILPANSTPADIQKAFFAHVALSNNLLSDSTYMRRVSEGGFGLGGSNAFHDGTPHTDGYMGESDHNAAILALDRFFANRRRGEGVMTSAPAVEMGYELGSSRAGNDGFNALSRYSQTYGYIMTNIVGDLSALHERISSKESGYFMPDVERSISLNGDRSAVIDLLMPDSQHLKRYAWDAASKSDVSVVRKSDKSGYLVGHNVITGVDRSGNPTKKRNVVAFRTESEAKAYAERVSQGDVEAEIPMALFKQGEVRLDTLDPKFAHQPNSGKADVIRGVAFAEDFYSEAENTYSNEDVNIYTNSELYFVGSIDTPFKTKAEAQAAASMLLKPEAITGKAPSVERASLSVSGVGLLENDIRSGLQFAVGGSHIQFAPKVLSVLRTAMVPVMERNKHGALKKVKKAVDVATGNEWYDMFMENQVSKAEMRVLGLTEFLYDNKDLQLTKQDVAHYIWAMYPTTGRLSHEHATTPYVTNVNSPSIAIRSSAHRLMAERARHMEVLQKAVEDAPEESKGEMLAYMDTIKKMHDNALQLALEQFYERDAATHLASDSEIVKSAANFTNTVESKRLTIDDLKAGTSRHSAITEPVMTMYRYMFNDAFAKARLEATARVAGFDLSIADFRGIDSPAAAVDWSFGARGESRGRKYEGQAVWNDVYSGDTSKYGLHYADTKPDYEGYASGIGSYRWDTLYTSMEIEKGNRYITGLKNAILAEADPQRKTVLESQLRSAERIQNVRKQANNATRNSGHKNTPSNTMQLGHARHSDVIVTAYHRPNAPMGELATSFNLDRPTIAALGMEELQSDPYQGATFGPSRHAMLGSTFEQVEGTKLIAEYEDIKARIEDKEQQAANRAQPLAWNTHPSFRTKHEEQALLLSAMNAWENGTPLFRYLMVLSYGENSRTDFGNGVRLNHEIKHKISKEMQERYGIKEDYVPEVEFTEEYDGHLHTMLRDNMQMMLRDHEVGLDHSLFSLVYGFGSGEKFGIAGTSSASMWRYQTQGLTGFANYIAMFGLQFNPEFVSKLEALHEHYRNYADDSMPPPIDVDRMAMEAVLDYKRRVERMTRSPDASVADGTFTAWKSQTLHSLKMLEDLYYQEGDGIVSFTNKRDNLHMTKHEMLHVETDVMAKKNQVAYFHAERLRHYIGDASNARPEMKAKDRQELLSSLTKKFRKGEHHKMLVMKPAELVAFDLRLRAKVHGFDDPFKFIDAIMDPNSPHSNWMVTNARAEVMKKILTNPSSVDAAEIQSLGDSACRIIRMADSDLDATQSNPVTRQRPIAKGYSRSALGRIFESSLPTIVDTYLSDKPDPELDVMRTRFNELKQKLGNMTPEDYTFPDTIPLGEDNAYRGVMTNWYAMRALQSKKDALVVMDARHHRSRYSSNNNTNTLFNFGGGVVGAINVTSMKKKHVMSSAYILHEAKKRKAHGGFIDALHSGTVFPTEFVANESTVNWNGLEGTIKAHLMKASEEIIAEMPMADTHIAIRGHVGALLDIIFVGDSLRTGGDTQRYSAYVKSIKDGTVNKETLIKRIEGLSEGKDTVKRVFNHFEKPEGVIMSVPIGRTHGYASNYGAPLWHNRLYYAGMHDGLINQVSHDAFEVPDVTMRDGKYVITDKKTGKVLAENIATFDEAQERAAQSSKYLGAVPIVSNFLKTFGKMGGYAMEGFMLATKKEPSSIFTAIGERMPAPSELQQAYAKQGAGAGMTVPTPRDKMASSFGDLKMPDEKTIGVINTMGRSEAKHGIYGPDSGEEGNSMALDHAVALHAMGVRAGSSAEEIAAGMHKMVGFTGPMLVIRPKFPTANHVAEAKKVIVQGIPFMSVSGVDSPAAMTKEAVEMYKWYAKGAKNQNQYEPRPKLN